MMAAHHSLILGLALAVFASAKVAAAAPYVPPRDDQVLLRVPPKPTTNRRDVFGVVTRGKGQLGAASLAASLVRQARQSGDPRYFGKAAAALAPFAGETRLVPAFLRVRAAVRAFEHQFAEAMADYRSYLDFEPQDDDVRFSLAVLLQISGDFDASRASCKALTSSEVALRELCMANVAVAALDWTSAEQHLAAFEAAAVQGVTPEWQAYAAELRAWCFAARGKVLEAKASFSNALSAPQSGNLFAADYRLASFVDFLLATGDVEGAKVAASSVELADRTSIALAVRRVMALKIAGETEAAKAAATELESDWQIERARGDGRHWREVALFELYVRGDGAAALAAASDNWRNGQREPLDGALLIAAAESAKKPEAADEVRKSFAARGSRSDDLRLFLPVGSR